MLRTILIQPTNINESRQPNESTQALVERLSHLKAQSCQTHAPSNAFIIPGQGQYHNLSLDWIERYLSAAKPYHAAGSLLFESHGFSSLKCYQSTDLWAIYGLLLFSLVDCFEALGLPLPWSKLAPDLASL